MLELSWIIRPIGYAFIIVLAVMIWKEVQKKYNLPNPLAGFGKGQKKTGSNDLDIEIERQKKQNELDKLKAENINNQK